MKHLKMLGLAAVAAMGLMAFVGAGTASATILCKTDVTHNCGSGWHVKGPITFSAEGSTFLTGPFGEIVSTCTGSTVSGNLTSTGGSSATQTVVGSITSLGFTGCTKTVTTTNTGGSQTTGTLEVHYISGTDNGTVTSNDTTVTIDNTVLGSCHFLTNNTDIGTLTGTQTANGAPIFHIEALIPSENCGFSGRWHGTYKYTGSEPFNVATS